MTSLTANASDTTGTRLSDMTPCPNCNELLIGPKSSSYLGLGRIAHEWECDRCGETFRTSARLAGMIEDMPANGDRAA